MLREQAGKAALSVEAVSHAYGRRQALDGVTFHVEPGRFSVLLGLNGAGKSTLFALITRLFAIRHGRIRVFGHDISRDPGEALRRLGVVFQSRTLDIDLSVMQNLLYHGALQGMGRRDALKRGEAVLDRAGLRDRAKDKARTLSGGQQRRVEIARSLMHRPNLLILDEPTVGLDIQARAGILDHVRRLAADEQVGVLWATHLIDEIEPGDDVVILHGGRVLAAGSVEQVMRDTGAQSIHAAFERLTQAAGVSRNAETDP